MNTHIDTLAEWWENAAEGIVQKGDTVIEHLNGGHHAVYIADMDQDRLHGRHRILARASKPKPAWHDAVAVIAHVDDFLGAQRRVFVRRTADFGGICWEDELSEWPSDELIDPVPLIEAKVTDEMVERLEGHFLNTALPEGLARRMLHAALGLETA